MANLVVVGDLVVVLTGSAALERLEHDWTSFGAKLFFCVSTHRTHKHSPIFMLSSNTLPDQVHLAFAGSIVVGTEIRPQRTDERVI